MIEIVLKQIEEPYQEEYLSQWTRKNPFVLGQITSARTTLVESAAHGFIGVRKEVFQDHGENARDWLRRLNSKQVMHIQPGLELDEQPVTRENVLSLVIKITFPENPFFSLQPLI